MCIYSIKIFDVGQTDDSLYFNTHHAIDQARNLSNVSLKNSLFSDF
jgi:hypothetical protein